MEKVQGVTALLISVLSLYANAFTPESETVPPLIALRRDNHTNFKTLRLEFINVAEAPDSPSFDAKEAVGPFPLLETVPGNSDLVVCYLTNRSVTEENKVVKVVVVSLKCLRKNGTFSYVPLPLENPSNPFIYFQVDGINVYWKQRTGRNVWATSLTTAGYSRKIAVTSTSSNDLGSNDEKFRIDTSIGVLFHINSEVFHINQNHRLRPVKHIHFSSWLTQEHAEMLVSHMAIDTKDRKLFFCIPPKILTAKYSPTGDVTFERIDDAMVGQKLEYFDYIHGKLVWKAENEVVSLMNTGTRNSILVSPKYHLLSIAVVKAGSEPQIHPATDSCPMELPLFAANYTCVCQAGYLGDGINCSHPYMLVRHSADDDTIVKIGSNPTVMNCNNGLENISLHPYCIALSNVSSPEVQIIQFDPFRMGYLQQDSREKRISYWNFNRSEPTTLLRVSGSNQLRASAMDFYRGILFWIQWGFYGGHTAFRVHSRMVSSGESPEPFVPFDGTLSSLTIDAQNSNLFWIHENAHAVTKSLIKVDYTKEGSIERETTFYSLTSNGILQAFDSHVIYYDFVEKNTKIVIHDVINRNETSIDLQKPLEKFYLLPDTTSAETLPTCHTECNEVCLPVRNAGHSSDTCRCYDDKIMSTDGNCHYFNYLTFELAGNKLAVHELEGRKGAEKRSFMEFLVNGRPRHIISSLNTETVCIQRSDGRNVTICRRRKEMNTFEVPEVNPSTALLQLSDDGDELYWTTTNDRGVCVRMRYLNRNRDTVIKFRCVEDSSTVLTRPVVDTVHKILFRYNGRDELHMSLLYQDQADYTLVLKYSTGTSAPKLLHLTPDAEARKLYFWTSARLLHGISYSEFDRSKKSFTLKDFILESENLGDSFFMQYYDNRIFNNWKNQLTMVNLISLKQVNMRLNLGQGSSGGEITRVLVQGRNRMPAEVTTACNECTDFCYKSSMTSGSVSCGCSEGFRLQDDRKACALTEPLPVNWIVGASIVALLICGTIVGIVVFVMRRSRNKYMRKALEQIHTGDPHRARTAATESDRAVYLPLPLAYIIKPSEVQVDNDTVLGEGQYGTVVQGLYKNMPVAIKTFKSIDLNTVVEFTKEIKIMAFIGTHPCITCFHGAVVGCGFFYAVMELCVHGNLNNYLTEKMGELYSNASEKEKTRLVLLMLSWCADIARGMDHLGEKKIIHGDLATRNVLLFDGLNAKITDFGLSRNVNPNYMAYQKTNLVPLPWKWMDYDALKRLSFSAESDVWAFGVTMWEIFSLGQTPYPQYVWDDDFTNALQKGRRLAKPEMIPDCIFEDVVKPCWELARAKRIKFGEIIRRLEEYQAHASCIYMVEEVQVITRRPS